MFALFFGNPLSVLSTVSLLAVLTYIAWTVTTRKSVERWGRKVLILALMGLLLCIFVVMRDGYVDAMQGGSGVFSPSSPQIILAYLAAGIIGVSALASLFVRNQKYRKILFFVLAAAIVCKALLIELSRITMI